VAAERDVVAQKFDVVAGEADLNSSFISASLLRGAAGKTPTAVAPKLSKIF